jgi:glycosyltransferase involved in cell wall biosynthesis
MLQDAFPEYEVEEINIKKIVPRSSLVNLYYLAKEYGRDIIRQKDKPGYYANRTSYYFQSVKRKVADRLRQREEYAFTFQTQSLYDASVDDIPHFVYTDHCHLARMSNYRDFSSELLPAWWIAMERKVYWNAERIFCMSTHVGRALESFYELPPEKVKCVYPGSNLKRSYNSSAPKHRQPVILYVSRFWKRKGGPLLLEAFRKLKQQLPAARLQIVGCKPEIEEEGVSVMGRVPMPQLKQMMRSASVYCIPHQKEPFSISFIDALANSLPIVVTHSGLRPDFVINNVNGYAIRHGSAGLLAGSLASILEDPQRQQEFGEASYRLYDTIFNWKKAASSLRREIMRSLGHPEVKANNGHQQFLKS